MIETLYQHTTDGGAQYLSIYPEGISFNEGIVARTDGGEIEIFTRQCEKFGINIKLN